MTHLTEDQFEQLYDESLDVEKFNALWHHLDHCEICFDQLSQRLGEHNKFLTVSDDRLVSDGFERNLMRRINREEAAQTVLRFSFEGLLKVTLFLSKAIFTIGSK